MSTVYMGRLNGIGKILESKPEEDENAKYKMAVRIT